MLNGVDVAALLNLFLFTALAYVTARAMWQTKQGERGVHFAAFTWAVINTAFYVLWLLGRDKLSEEGFRLLSVATKSMAAVILLGIYWMRKHYEPR